MKLKTHHIFYLFVVVFVLSVYYFDYYRGEENKKKQDQEAILLPYSKDDITKIELKNTSGELELVKKDTGWELTKPVIDLAATDEITGWIQTLTTEKSLEKIGEGESFEWSTYGLEQPRSSMVLTLKSGEKVKIDISGRKNFEGNPFIRRNQEKLVYVGSISWSSLVEKNVKEVRDRRLLRTPLAELSAFSLKQKGSDLLLELKSGKWTASQQPGWDLDQNKVREIVNVVQDMRATEFVLETEPNAAEAGQYGFVPAALTVTYTLAGNKTVVVELGQSKDKVWYAWPKDLKRVVKVEAPNVEKLTKAQLSDLRDREKPFAFNKDEVKKVSIDDGKVFELSKEGETWKASIPGTVDTTEVNNLFSSVQQLRVAEFLDGKVTAPGLNHSKKRFALVDAQGKSLIELKIGDSYTKKEDKVDKKLIYVKSSLYPHVVALNEEDLKFFNSEKLVKSETKNTEQKNMTTEQTGGLNKEEIKKQ